MNDSSPPLEIPISAWSAATDALTETRQTHGMPLEAVQVSA